jgi:hypothetical protein
MDPYSAAGVGAGLAQGVSNFEKTLENRRKMQMLEQTHSMQMQQGQTQNDMMQLQLQQLQAQMKQAELDRAKTDAINAHLAFLETNNDAYIKALPQNPVIGKLLSDLGATSIHSVDEYSPDKLSSLGFDPEAMDSKNMLVAEDAQGNARLYNPTGMLLRMGGFSLLSKKTQDEIANRINVAKARVAETSAETSEVLDDAKRAILTGEGTPEERLKKLANAMKADSGRGAGAGYSPSNIYKMAMEASTLLDKPIDKAYDELYTMYVEGKPTAGMKEAKETVKVQNTIASEAPDFFDTVYKPGTPAYVAMEQNIQKIEKYQNIKLSSSDKKELSEIKSIVELAGTAEKLTPKDTGVIDNFLGNISKYVSDSPEAPSRIAYNQMFATLRNNLFGATLPEGERQLFTQAYGSLYQQVPAIREALRQSLLGLKAKLSTVADTGDSYVTHFRLGADMEKVNRIIANLDFMIDVTQGGASPSGSQAAPASQTVPEARPGYRVAKHPTTGEFIYVKIKE